MGFSLLGTILSLIILAPNLLFIKFPPVNMPADIQDAGPVFTVLERVGQVGCVAILVFSKSSFEQVRFGIVTVLIIIILSAYYGLWIRYLVKGRNIRLLYEPLSLIPIPMAIFPVAAFALGAIWCESLFLSVAVVCLAIGHFTNSWVIRTRLFS